MPVVNPLARELVFKVVYYGPGLGGKTTTLQHIHATTRPEHRGKMVSLATPVDRTLYFDFLPIRVPSVRGMSVRLQLFTVPGQVYYNATRKLVLTGADGVVLVVDSQRLRVDASLESLENLRDNLREHGRSLEEVPLVLQWNKRDLSDLVPLEELEARMNPGRAPAFPTVATSGEGVYEALEAVTRAVLLDFQRRIPESRGLPGHDLELPEGGLVEALRLVEGDAARSERPGVESAVVRAQSPRHGVLAERAAGMLADAGRVASERVAAAEPTLPPLLESEAPESSQPPLTPRNLAPPGVPAPPQAPSDPAPPETRPSVRPGAVGDPSVAEVGFGFVALFGPGERADVADVERALARGLADQAVLAVDRLVARTLAGAAALLGGSADAPREPALMALLLGLDGARWGELRALVREARAGASLPIAAALRAYLTALELRAGRQRLEEGVRRWTPP